MSSRLGLFGRRYLDSNTMGSRASLRAQLAVPVPCGPSYGGYCPDLVPQLSTLSDAQLLTGLVTRGGGLTQDDGFSRIDPTRLPLGDSTPPASPGFPVVGLFQSYDVSAPGPVRLAVTSSDGTNSRLYELASGVWTHRAAESSVGDRDMDNPTTAADLVDWAFFPPAVSAGTNRGCAVFTNNSDRIMRYPGVTTATTYDEFDQSGAYLAKSVEVAEDRVLALNVSEAGTRRINRLLWTHKAAAPSFSTVNVGAGFADFVDVKGQGLKVMNLGQLVALYFESAVVVLQKTRVDVDPFRRVFTSHDRGILSTHSVVQLGSGVHFGIFTDGWFFFDDQARWEEVGVRTANGTAFHKWHKTFYELLDWENRSRVVCIYDPVNRFVRISFPTRGQTNPDMVWNYDILTDSVWPDEGYGSAAPNIWGTWFDVATAAGTWATPGATVPGSTPWDSVPGVWDDYAATRGRYRTLHGTTSGLVFKHDPFIVTRDGSLGAYRYKSPQLAVGGTALQRTAKRLIVGYERQISSGGSDPSPISTTLHADSGQSATRAIPQTKGQAGTFQTDWVAGQVSGVHVGWEISGTAPITIASVDLMVTLLGRNLASDQ